MASRPSVTYRLLGNERIAFTQRQIEGMVRDGMLDLDTKVSCDGEGFATAIGARPEFRRLLDKGDGSTPQRHGR
jgi:hypothetical protein